MVSASNRSCRVSLLPEASFDLVSAKYLNPTPDLTGQGIRWSGNINAGASLTNGNSETRQLRFDAETIARALRQRYTVGGQFNRAEDRGRDTLFNSRANAKYDYFFSKKWYGYSNVTLENDRFRDLRLRSTIGAGSGYQIFETPNINLSLEAGLNYVSEDYYEEEDNAAAVGASVSSRWLRMLQIANDSRRRSWRAISVHQNSPSTS